MNTIITAALLGLGVIVESTWAYSYWPSKLAIVSGIAALLTWFYIIYQAFIEARKQGQQKA